MAFRILMASLFFCLAFGCARQHIYSSGPGQASPVPTEKSMGHADEAASTDAPSIQTGSDEADAVESDEPAFTESSIEEEVAIVEKDETKPSGQMVAVDTDESSSAPLLEAQTKEEPDAGESITGEGLYFIQVGAFEDPAKARRILAALMSDGYTGSRMIKDAGLYKVQAGGFTDEQSARDGLQRFRKQYPGSFLTR